MRESVTMDDVLTYTADVLVIGAGAAGCRAAIEAADLGASVLMLVKGRFTHSGSSFYPLTEGLGFTTAIPNDVTTAAGVQAHYDEIMGAGAGMTSPSLARVLAEDAPRRFQELIDRFGVPLRPTPMARCCSGSLITAAARCARAAPRLRPSEERSAPRFVGAASW